MANLLFIAIIAGLAYGLYLLWRTPTQDPEKIKPGDLRIQTSARGLPIPIIFGRREVAGNLIWYDNFQAHRKYEEVPGGKGGTEMVHVGYTYTCSFAFAWGQGPLVVRNLYRGKDLIPLPGPHGGPIGKGVISLANIRHYMGTEFQIPDPHIAHFTPRAPAFRGVAYTVFENFRLGEATFLPNFNAEVHEGEYRKWGVFSLPDSMFIDGDEVFVGSWALGVVRVTDLVGVFRRDLPAGGGRFMWVDGDELYVTFFSGGWSRIRVIDKRTGAFLRGWIIGGNITSPAFGVYGDRVYTVETNKLRIYDKLNSSGSAFGTLIFPMRVLTQLSDAYGIAFHDNRMYVTCLDRVHVFTFMGDFLFSSPWHGGMPHGLRINEGEIFVSDRGAHRIVVLSLDGRFIRSFGSYGTADGQFNRPNDVHIYRGGVYVLDQFNSCVHAFFPIGNEMAFFTPDVSPPLISRLLLTQHLGLPTDRLDLPSFAETDAYCRTHDFLMTLVIDRESSVLDILQRILLHHGGYLTYVDGGIAHKQLKAETITNSITVDADIVARDEPYEIERTGFREIKNKIIASYTKRADRYSGGTETATDDISVNQIGPRVGEIELGGFTTPERAAKRAHGILHQAINLKTEYSFEVGLRNAEMLTPGSVFALTDTQMGLDRIPLRVISSSEGKEGKIAIRAIEEPMHIVDAQPVASPVPWRPPERGGVPQSVRHPMVSEIPALIAQDRNVVLIQFSAGIGANWAGASIHQSFDNTTYSFKHALFGAGLTGVVNAVTDRVVTVTITDTGISLGSVADVFALLQSLNTNLCWVEETNSYFRFARATLIGPAQWNLEGFIWHPFTTPFLRHEIVAGQHISFMRYNMEPTPLEFSIDRQNRDIWFKIVSFNFFGESEDIALVPPERITFRAQGSRPIAPQNLEIDGRGGITRIPRADIPFRWRSCSRHNRGLDFTRSDQISEDADFVRFDLFIRQAGVTLRSLSVTGTTWAYTTAMQLADGNPTAIMLEVIKRVERNSSEGAILSLSVV